MKKLLLVLAIGAFAACNDSATSTDNSVDSSSTTTVDSLQVSGDTTTVVDTLKVDTSKADTLKK